MGRIDTLTKEEVEHIEKSGTCSACGHLDVLHTYHCCTFCNVKGCHCEWGEIVPVPGTHEM